MTSFTQKLSFLFPARDLKDTLVRFPLSALCALLLFILTIGEIHDLFKPLTEDVVVRLAAILICGYFWFGAAQLFIESRTYSRAPLFLMSLLIYAVIAFLLFNTAQFALHMWFVVPAILLLIGVSPFRISSDNFSFWYYNHTLWAGVAVAMLASLIMWGGVSAALLSIQYLFDIDIKEELYGDIGALACIILGPLNALSSVPRRFVFTQDECRPAPGVAFLLNWILAPLVLFYLLILYAYFIKILLVQEVPRGQIAYMTMGFAGTGIMTYLGGWALGERANALTRIFQKYFFPALIVPVCVMAFAAGERISQYGVTEQRYSVALAALWLGFIAVAYTFRKLPLKIMPESLAIILLLASFGPWSAASVSEYSQSSRLEELLIRNEILKDGKIVKTSKDVPQADRQSISSILDYFLRTERFEELEEMGIEPGIGDVRRSSYDIAKDMGFDYASPWDNPDLSRHFSYSTNSGINHIVELKGYDYGVTSMGFPGGNEWKLDEKYKPVDMPSVKISRQQETPNIFKVQVGDKAIEMDLSSTLAANIKDSQWISYDKPPPFLKFENDQLRVGLYINSISGKIIGEQPQTDSLFGDLLIDIKP